MGKRWLRTSWSSTRAHTCSLRLGIDDITCIRIGQLLSPARAGMAPSAHTLNERRHSLPSANTMCSHALFLLNNRRKWLEPIEITPAIINKFLAFRTVNTAITHTNWSLRACTRPVWLKFVSHISVSFVKNHIF